MAFSSLRKRAVARSGFRSLVAGLLLWPALGLAAPTAPMAEKISVNVDQAKLVRLPGKIATIVVGNPLIADVTLQAGIAALRQWMIIGREASPHMPEQVEVVDNLYDALIYCKSDPPDALVIDLRTMARGTGKPHELLAAVSIRHHPDGKRVRVATRRSLR